MEDRRVYLWDRCFILNSFVQMEKYEIKSDLRYQTVMNYHDHTLSDGDISNTTTNSLENVNLQLKKFLGIGFLSKKTALVKLKSFHTEMICKYTEPVVGNKLLNILYEYYS